MATSFIIKSNSSQIFHSNTGTISTWEKLYHSYGFSGLLAKKRGRPSMKNLNLNTKLTNLKRTFLC